MQNVDPVPVASALRVRNFKALIEAAGEEPIAEALCLTLPRVRELCEGINFGDETAYHVESTLGLKPGYFDMVNPRLTDEEVSRLKSGVPDVSVETPPMDELPLAHDTLQEQSPEPVAPVTALPVAPPAHEQDAGTQTRDQVGETSPSTGKNSSKEPAMPTPAQNPSDRELELMEIRRHNLAVLTEPLGMKSALAKFVGMSPANISHRLHGNTSMDKENAEFFCEKLNLPKDWFEAPRTAADVPAHVWSMLSSVQKTSSPARPARKPRKRKAAPEVRSDLEMPTPARAPRKTRAPAMVEASMGAAAAPQVQAAAPAAPASMPVAVPALQTDTPLVDPAELKGAGPVATALVQTLGLKVRQGKVSEEVALKWLVEVSLL